MSSYMSNLALLNKCQDFILKDPTNQALDTLIKNALISAERDIRKVDQLGGPLAWLRESYDELFTNYYATISAITQADPGVMTAASADSDVTGHGYSTDDLVVLNGVGDMERLNERLFRFVSASATTGSLKQLDGKNVINTTNYEEYASGGTIYHAGIKLPSSTIEPSSTDTDNNYEATADYRWKIGWIYNATFDLFPAYPMPEVSSFNNVGNWQSGGRPDKFRHVRYTFGNPGSASVEHFLIFNKLAAQRYNIRIFFEKDYPDLSTWTDAVYPPHPPEIHDYIWHRALAYLVGNSERMRRSGKDNMDNTKMEILYSERWLSQMAVDEGKIIQLNRKMLGDGPHSGGMSA